MSLASILNDNDDISFPEAYIGTLTADTITARVINGGSGGGGGGNFSTPSQQALDMNVNQIENIYRLNLTNQDNGGTNLDLQARFINGKSVMTIQQGPDDVGIIYDTFYNPLPASGGASALSTYFVSTTKAPGIAIVDGTSNFSSVYTYTLPSPCTVVRCSFSIFQVMVAFTATPAKPIILTFQLGNFIVNTSPPALDRSSNQWACTITTTSTFGAFTLPDANTIDLWYCSPTPVSSVSLCVQVNSGAGNGSGSITSIQCDGLVTASNDVMGTITLV
jgi:hypothetical protein